MDKASIVITSSNTPIMMSPTVVHDGTQFIMWYNSGGNIYKRTSIDCYTWSDEVKTTVTGLTSGKYVFHLDVYLSGDGRLEMLAALNTNRLAYGLSLDGGDSWVLE
ncbi:hypothetical protein CUU66_01185 [Peribacillus deserti]|uniref:Uncharacterized protein n=1 Tax=Peribacillus deserti TaxID=673318 RepID=A0A2N5MBR6_9BACI|nr:hypothetical protein CUU66_01185 [Peribacillus deserti]